MSGSPADAATNQSPGTPSTDAPPCRDVVPAFAVSNVTWEGMTPLLAFLAALQPQQDWTRSSRSSVEFAIEDVLSVDGHTVVTGLVRSGTLESGPLQLLLGPDLLGNFIPVQVRSIQANRVPVTAVAAGHMCTCSLEADSGGPLPRATVRRGQVMLRHGGSDAGLLAGPRSDGGIRRQTSAPTTHSLRKPAPESASQARDTAGGLSAQGIALSIPRLEPRPLGCAPGSNVSPGAASPLPMPPSAPPLLLKTQSADDASPVVARAAHGRNARLQDAPAVTGLLPAPLPHRTRRVLVASTFDATIAACTRPELALRPGQTVTVFCAFVRQAARVVSVRMLEHPPPLSASTSLSVPPYVDSATAASSPRAAPSSVEQLEGGGGEAAISRRQRLVRLRLLHHPEYLVPGTAVVLRDGRCLAAGTLTSVLPFDSRSLSAPAQRSSGSRALGDRRRAELVPAGGGRTGGVSGVAVAAAARSRPAGTARAFPLGSATPAPKFSRRGTLESPDVTFEPLPSAAAPPPPPPLPRRRAPTGDSSVGGGAGLGVTPDRPGQAGRRSGTGAELPGSGREARQAAARSGGSSVGGGKGGGRARCHTREDPPASDSDDDGILGGLGALSMPF